MGTSVLTSHAVGKNIQKTSGKSSSMAIGLFSSKGTNDSKKASSTVEKDKGKEQLRVSLQMRTT